MRFALPLIAAVALAVPVLSANATPPQTDLAPTYPGVSQALYLGNANGVVGLPITKIAARCGRHAHWVPRHRVHGRWVGGHCEPSH